MFEKKFNIIIAVFLLLFVTVIFMSLTNTRLPFFSRATNKELDITKTVVILSKLEVVANGIDSSKISVFTRNDNGTGLSGRRVNISSTLGVVNPPSMVSDNYGKTEFKLTSTNIGTADLSISVDNQPVESKYSVKFTAD